MEFSHFVEWAFYGILSGCALFAVSILSKLNSSVAELNAKVAVVIEKTLSHEKRLDRHDEIIESLRKN